MLSKIKSWPSCLPDASSSLDPVLEVYPEPRVLDRAPLPGEDVEQPESVKRKRDDDAEFVAAGGTGPSGKRRAGTKLEVGYRDATPSVNSHAELT
jgi:hypothetical protein